MATIRKIEAKPTILLSENDGTVRKRRVAAYARVSTEQEEQQSSYETQVSFYTSYIKSNPEWEFAGIYSDEGISGTNTKHREGFKTMIEDALNGKIDLILTKSISRFARNTVDSLVTIRKLKEKGVEVYFEKENIYSMDSKGELMLTIMSSIAQEESRSISENVTWGRRKGMAEGKVYMSYKCFLGYERGEDGKPVINEKEADIVRKIYSLCLKGLSYREIADYLDSTGVPTPKQAKHWYVRTVISILTNEKYKGDALLQKTFAVDWLNKKRKVNTGELPQYYIEGSHPAIVSSELFDLVQEEIRKRKEQNKRGRGVFFNKLVCGECGAFYGRKVWHSNTPNKCYIWRCNAKYSGDKKCSTPVIREEHVELAFVEVFNRLIKNKSEYIAKADERLEKLIDAVDIEDIVSQKERQCQEAYDKLRGLVEENSVKLQNQSDYANRFNELEANCRRLDEELKGLKAKALSVKAQREQITQFLQKLRLGTERIAQFDENIWYSLVEKVVFKTDGCAVFEFKDGTKIKNPIHF